MNEVPAWEINTIDCYNSSITALLANNDINATSVGFECIVEECGAANGVTISVEITLQATAAFWQFLLEERVLKPFFERRHGAKTLVRLSYKANQMNLPFETRDLDPTSETVAKSHADKLKEMKDWNLSPFKKLLKTVKNKSCGGYSIVQRL